MIYEGTGTSVPPTSSSSPFFHSTRLQHMDVLYLHFYFSLSLETLFVHGESRLHNCSACTRIFGYFAMEFFLLVMVPKPTHAGVSSFGKRSKNFNTIRAT